MTEKVLVYDIEIVKAIPDKRQPKIQGIEYCEGWGDLKGMGVSVICAYDYAEDRTRVFCKDNFDEFFILAKSSTVLVGFNNTAFDNGVLDHIAEMPPGLTRYYDILRELWVASGLSPNFGGGSHTGFGLDDTSCANGLVPHWSGHRSLAAIQWQRGEVGTVIDYCLNDVLLTKQLLDKINLQASLTSPKDGSELKMPKVS